MKGKFLALLLILLLTLACDTEAMISTQIPVAVTQSTQLPKLMSIFKLSVLVDLNSEPVTRKQAQAVVDEASEILFGLTSFQMKMISWRNFSRGGTTQEIIQEYLDSAPASIPNGIILFSFGDDGMAKTYGGYSYTLPGPAGYINRFDSPYVPADHIYIGVIHFGHRYARCGYGDSETPISDVSIDGECSNQPGTACVERFGYSMCSNAVDDLYASTSTYMASSSIVHEIMHSFGRGGVLDHYFTPECTKAMQSGISVRPYQADSFNKAEAGFYINMCPFIFDNFVNSYGP